MAERRPYPFLQPGMTALQTGSRHAYLAGLMYDAFGHLTKKQKTSMPALKRSYTKKNAAPRKYTKKSKGKGVSSDVKKTILAMATRYESTIPDAVGGVFNMTSNTIYSLNLTAFIDQGVTNQDRQGDAIFLEMLKLRGYVNSTTAGNAYSFRVMVGWSGEDYTLVTMANTGLTGSEIFLPSTGTTSTVHRIVNPKAFTVLYDSTIDVNSQLSTSADISSVIADIPLYQKFQYQSTASALGKTKNLFLVVIGYGVGLTTGSGVVGSSQINSALSFKNL